MSEFVFDYADQIEALYKCGVPFEEIHGIYFTEADLKNGNMELPEWFQKQVQGETPESAADASGDIDLPF